MGKYQTYPEYQDSGVEWLGEIPSTWQIKKLKYLCDTQTGTKDTVNAVEEGKYPFFVRSQTVERINSVGADCEAVLTAGDGVGVGKVYHYVNGKFDFHQRVYMLNNFKNVTGRFVFYYLSSNFYKVALEGNAKSTVDSLRLPQFLNFAFSLPPVDEQNNIVNFLDHETTKIDTLIEKQQLLIKLLKEKRQAVISYAVTKGLNPQAPMKDSGVEWLGEVPEHWGVLRLKHLIESLESGVSVNAADIPARTDEVGVLKTSCVYTRTFRAEENKTVVPEDLHRVKCPVRKGAIIISRMNTPELVGASALVNEDVSNVYLPDRLWQTNFNQKVDLDSEYLAHFMTVEGFRVQISLAAEGASSSMQNIAKEDYLSINCLLPPLSEQQQIVQYIRQRLEYFSKLDSNANDAVNLLKERRTALISAAVTGKIDVRDWKKEN
ncbi:TPA: restriction endonuclease subunit S [Vibrio parahaemolyticus]|nr:restriction endonuclease subunit S [Vibrio parahaemolyticus]HCH1505062.1 restriction endonuclease subunit S [Vibrio parahaemolyticus]HCH1506200.1 restriction endonuclease subunit S [Vibrio parahaemolyticus]HCH4862755.1 restriction endonuclease subunit S [Vibrio parahaemolyticus]HCH4867415.1 restriction endonuclease subunit S [Vibrio parahaemolyticus]